MLGIYDLEICDFSFHTDAGDKKPHDPRVSQTITGLLEAYFTIPDRVAVYFCDASDGRPQARQRLFKQWLENSTDTIQHEDLTIAVGEGMVAYGAILTHKDMAHRDVLQREFADKLPGMLVEKNNS